MLWSFQRACARGHVHNRGGSSSEAAAGQAQSPCHGNGAQFHPAAA